MATKTKPSPSGQATSGSAIALAVSALVAIDQQIAVLQEKRREVCKTIENHCLRQVGIATEQKPVEFIVRDTIVTVFSGEKVETRKVAVLEPSNPPAA